jgi:hypothetical protein
MCDNVERYDKQLFDVDAVRLAAADTSNPQVVARLNVDLTKRERYLYLAVTPLTNQAICALARLGYADETPTSAANLGVAVAKTA